MTEPTLLQQAREHLDASFATGRQRRADQRIDHLGIAVGQVLQYLEQRHADASGPAREPGESCMAYVPSRGIVEVQARRGAPSDALNLDALQRLCDAATPGPWRVDEDGDLRAGGEAPYGLCTLAVLRAPCPVVDNTCGINESDPAFIAAAREALPKLIDLVRKTEPIADAVDRAPRCPKCHKPWLGSTRYAHQVRRCMDDAFADGCDHAWNAEAEHG